MKSTIFTAFLLFCGLQQATATGIEFFHGSWEEAKEMAKTEQKLIFVDAFASWCGPCKHMAANVFTDAQAGEFFNANFICLKIDMEKLENATFAAKYPVSAYPTLMFINSEGKIILKEVGAKPVAGLIEMGKKALGMQDNLPELDLAYESGKRDPDFMYNYVRALNRSGKPSLKFTNEYLSTQKDLTTEFNRRFIFEGAVEADSRVFDLLLQQREAIGQLVGSEAVVTRFELACKKTAQKAVDFHSPELLAEAKAKMAKAVPERAESFGYEADLRFYASEKDIKSYLKAAQGYQKSTVKNNSAKLHSLVQTMVRDFPSDSKILEQAAKWENTAAEFGGMPEYYYGLAEIYEHLGKREEAIKAARKGLEVTGEKDDTFRIMLEGKIRKLESK